MDPRKRVVVCLASIRNAWDEAQQAAVLNDHAKMFRKIQLAFELLEPFVRSMEMLDAGQAKTLGDFLKPEVN